MSKTQNEREREYYNKKLIKEGFESEMKKPHKIDWNQLFCQIIGIALGLSITNYFDSKKLVNNTVGSFVVDVIIIIIAVIVVYLIDLAIVKIIKKGRD